MRLRTALSATACTMALASVCLGPAPVLAQANTGGSSMQTTTTQTTPNPGPLSGYPAARDSATVGTQITPGLAQPIAPGAGEGGSAVRGTSQHDNPSGAATGEGLRTSGGRAAAPGAPPDAAGAPAAPRGR